ncbi:MULTISPECIES: type II toxin-antitoxin system prevent-host-death family antitoxin [unclassified Novosphingobium]|nr:type II toxin-antitoxin system prevent-host-death family antitoxin [Novosphingobium sp. ST904]
MDELLGNLASTRQPLVITQNGRPMAVLQAVGSFDQTRGC